jgi:hypothetical protein
MSPPKLLLFVFACSAGACATSSNAFGPTGYEQTIFHYQIAYAEPKGQHVLGADWRLDNLVWDDTVNGFVNKSGPQYRAFRSHDDDGDGVISPSEKHEEGIYDLRYLNTRDGGVIWTKAHPLDFKDAARDLDVVLEDYADGLTGTGAYDTGSLFGTERVTTRKFLSFITERGPMQVGPNLGVVALIELAETERLRLDPQHRDGRLKIAFSKMAYRVDEDTVVSDMAGERHSVRCGAKLCNEGIALLVIGYYNDAPHFAEHAPEFDAFVKRYTLPPESLLPTRYQSRPVKTSSAAPVVPSPDGGAPTP